MLLLEQLVSEGMRDIYVAATIVYDGDQRSKKSPRVSSYRDATVTVNHRLTVPIGNQCTGHRCIPILVLPCDYVWCISKSLFALRISF